MSNQPPPTAWPLANAARYWLSGARAGQLDVLVERLPGMPDGIKAAPDGGFWVGLVTPLAPVLRLLKYKAVRALMAHLPDWARPPIAK